MHSFQQFRNEVLSALKKAGIKEPALEAPPENVDADLAVPCFMLAKEMKKAPVLIAKELAGKIHSKSLIGKAEALGPYVNFSVNWDMFAPNLLEEIGENYAKKPAKKKALVEHTSINPNASPHVGRSRNAILGDSIVRVLNYSGFAVETHYFVNDIGKQIAMLVIGCKGKKTRELAFNDMLKIYRDINAELEANPDIETEISALLNKLEAGDKKTIARFHEIVEICAKGQVGILSKLNINYDVFDYESQYVTGKKLPSVMKALEKTGYVITDDDNRRVLHLKDSDLPEGNKHLVVERSDGTSMYALRDIAYTIDKIKRAKDANIVVLGEDHKLYFQQLAEVMRVLGYTPPKVVHYSFILLPSGKMSTRKGEVVLLEDLLNEATDAALVEIKTRYPDLPKAECVSRAEKIAVAAVRYGIIKVSPEKNIVFHLKDALRFEGDTGPYLQYTTARANSMLKKGKPVKKFDAALLKEMEELAVMRKLALFPGVVDASATTLQPHLVATYIHELADSF
ncbi:MAG: arginine--tRNA ligase, partial [Candidatus Aenigmarchaeota archaeon]|nr:arginine--tRNA ligase [Candidatus Aenigmarchaeota archaeon]